MKHWGMTTVLLGLVAITGIGLAEDLGESEVIAAKWGNNPVANVSSYDVVAGIIMQVFVTRREGVHLIISCHLLAIGAE